MNVLIISQPVLSYSNNMGKTLMAYFSAFPANNVSQFFYGRESQPIQMYVKTIIAFRI